MIPILIVCAACAGLGLIAGLIRLGVESNEKMYVHFKKYRKRYKTLAGLVIIAAFMWLAYSEGWIFQRNCSSYDFYVCND